MSNAEPSIEERISKLELVQYDLSRRVAEHQGFIWRASEDKYRDKLFCIFMAVVTGANLLCLAIQILQ